MEDSEEELGTWERFKEAVTRPDDYEFNPPLTRDMGFLSRNRGTTPKSVQAASFLSEALPVIGDTKAAEEVWNELQKAEPNYYLAGALGGATIVGLIPGLGDAAAGAIKRGAREVFDVAKRVEVSPNSLGSMGGNIRLRSNADHTPPSNLEEWSRDSYFKDPNTGSPQQMYHGMGGTLRGEPVEFLGDNLGTSSGGTLGPGTYLTNDPSVASDFATNRRAGYTDEKYGGQVLPVYTNVTKVVDDSVINSNRELRDEVADLIDSIESDSGYLSDLSGRLKGEETVSLSSLFTKVEDGDVKGSGIGGAVSELFENRGYEAVSVVTDKGFHEAVIFPGNSGQAYPQQNIKSSLQGPDGAYSRSSNNMSFAEGGIVPGMDDQVTKMYNQGGQVDPVSGNEIPPGVGPEQVRDDIKANLSEGEYVVPADVVKYFGVAHFEKLRDKAKAGMQELDEGGRIGGEPGGGDTGMAEGGLVPGKSDFDPSAYKPGFSISKTAPISATVADPVCPDGYLWDKGSQTCQPVSPASSMTSSGSSTSSRAPVGTPLTSNPNAWMEKFSYNDPNKLFSETMESIRTQPVEEDTEASGGLLDSVLSGAAGLLSGGLAGGILGKFMSTTNAARAAANARVLEATHPELAAQINAQNATYVNDNGLSNVPKPWRDGDVLAESIRGAKGDLMSAWSTSAPVPTYSTVPTAAQAPITKDQGYTGSDDTGMPTLTKQNTGVTGQTKTPNLPNTPPPSVSTPTAPTTTTANTGPAGLGSKTESVEEKIKRGGGFAKGGLVTKRTKKNK